MTAPLLIPTRNRPVSLYGVLSFVDRFYPSARVIVADGSNEAAARRNVELMERLDTLDLDYRRFPYETPFFDRLLDVLESLSGEDHVVMGADDDYPMLDVLWRGEDFLRKNRDYSTALGCNFRLSLTGPDRLVARLGVARPITDRSVERRLLDFAAWSFSTTYAVTRRDLLLERYRRARALFLPGFFDFVVGLEDCIAGKIHAMPEIGFITTKTYTHSYLRPDSGLVFLRRSDEVLALLDRLVGDLVAVTGLDAEAAKPLASRLFRFRIRELVGRPAHTSIGFRNSRLFRNPVVQAQMGIHEDLFRPETDLRQRYSDRLEHIGEALRASMEAHDNKDERRTYETLEQQAEG